MSQAFFLILINFADDNYDRTMVIMKTISSKFATLFYSTKNKYWEFFFHEIICNYLVLQIIENQPVFLKQFAIFAICAIFLLVYDNFFPWLHCSSTSFLIISKCIKNWLAIMI